MSIIVLFFRILVAIRISLCNKRAGKNRFKKEKENEKGKQSWKQEQERGNKETWKIGKYKTAAALEYLDQHLHKHEQDNRKKQKRDGGK